MFSSKFIPLALSTAALIGSIARAEVSPVSMRVEQVSGSKPEKYSTTQKRSLKIHLTNGSAQDLTGLKVKYYFFAKEVKEKDITVKDKGEKSADVKARATEVVETPVVTATSVEGHSEGSNGGWKGSSGGRSSGHKVEASGEKIVGYGAQLYSGDKLLTEYFSEPSLKTKVDAPAK
jgi:hypothetical protein